MYGTNKCAIIEFAEINRQVRRTFENYLIASVILQYYVKTLLY